MAIGVTFGWLVALACAAIAVAKALPPQDVDSYRQPLVPRGPLQWMVWTALAMGTFQAGLAVDLIPFSSAGVTMVQAVLWITGVLLMVPVVRRVRFTRRWDAFLAPIVIDELLPELTAVQRRVPDTSAGDLLEKSRSAAAEGRGLQALSALCQAAEQVQHLQAPATDEWAALYKRLEHLRRIHAV
ncbi:hypothetical protein [Streptomyces sp. XH2]|uniref:hypothetical protein n=1 Tax=Streptomyces sp. XH2 TaxID=3412483 RepID=UPI003C7B2540